MNSINITTATTAKGSLRSLRKNAADKNISQNIKAGIQQTSSKNIQSLAVIYVLLTCISTLSLFDGLPTSLKVFYFPFIGLAAAALALGYHSFLIAPCGAFLKEYLGYVLILAGTTSVIYFLEASNMELMKRGYEKIAYQALTVLITVAAFYMFGEKAMDYTLYGFVLFYAVSIMLALQRSGFSAAVKDFIYFVTSGGDAEGFMKCLELHDAVFAFGCFLIYYAIKGIRKNKGKFIMAVICFLLGMKRIGIIAVIIAILFYRFAKKRKMSALKISLITGITVLVLGFLYILSVYLNWFQLAMSALNVDTMGRNELYRFIGQYYNLSPLFHGHGFEFVTQLMKTATIDTFNMAKIGAIHNGYVTIYLEFGFIGYFIWNIYWLIWHPIWLNRFGDKAVLAQLAISIYLFLTYATDNTAFYFSTGIVARLVPMMFIAGQTLHKKGVSAQKV